MPVVAQINVNFANLEEVRNLSEFDLTAGGDFQIEDKTVNPNTLSKYCLYNREFGEDGDFGISDIPNLAYLGGFITAGDRINVKHDSDLQLRQSLDVEKNIYAEYIYSRRKGNTIDTYQTDRALNPRFVTISPKETDKSNTYVTVHTIDNNNRYIELFAQRAGSSNVQSIRVESNTTNERIDITAPVINLKKQGVLTGTVNIDSYLNIANDTKINADKFTVTASSGETKIAGNLNIGSITTGTGAYGKFTINSTTGDTVIQGTVNITGVTTVNNNFTQNGGTGETFSINNGSGINKFTVDTTTGNTNIQGTLDVTSTSTLRNSVSLIGGSGESFTITNGSTSNTFTVDTFTGNTTIAGTLNLAKDFLINTNFFTVQATTGDTKIKGDLSIGSTNLYDRFTVDSVTGNTAIQGTLQSVGKFTGENNTNSIYVQSQTAAVLTAIKNNDYNNSIVTNNYNAVNVRDIVDALVKTRPPLYFNNINSISLLNSYDQITLIINSSSTVTVTCPSGLVEGLQVSFVRAGTGDVILAAGGGASILSAPANTFRKLAFTNSVATCLLASGNRYFVFGDLLPAT